MKLRLHDFDLRLAHRFTIARGGYDVQRTLVVELTDGRYAGYGEATENSYYGHSRAALRASVESVRPQIEAAPPDDPSALWQTLALPLADDPFALSAIDQAAHDLWGKRCGEPVYRLWRLDVDNLPPSSFTIGIDTPDEMVARLHERPGWPVYKLKLGTPRDLECVRRLRRETPVPFRVDANGGWSAEESLSLCRELAELGVEFIEQPLPPEDDAAQEALFSAAPLPLLADESCRGETDVARCAGRFHGINIKLVKCGGLTPARRMIEAARDLGLQVMIGCMTESSVGISAAAQLLPLVDHADLDGAALLAEDVASGVTVERGQVRYPDRPGTGVRLLKE